MNPHTISAEILIAQATIQSSPTSALIIAKYAKITKSAKPIKKNGAEINLGDEVLESIITSNSKEPRTDGNIQFKELNIPKKEFMPTKTFLKLISTKSPAITLKMTASVLSVTGFFIASPYHFHIKAVGIIDFSKIPQQIFCMQMTAWNIFRNRLQVYQSLVLLQS